MPAVEEEDFQEMSRSTNTTECSVIGFSVMS